MKEGNIVLDFDDELVSGSVVTHDGAVVNDRVAAAHRGGARLMDGFALITITILAVFLGFEVVSKVSSTLHTPLMSEANAIHGIILLGAILVAGQAEDPLALALSILAVLLATINVVGGFVVTDRMLLMFRAKPRAEVGCREVGGRRVKLLPPEVVTVCYIIAAVLFILALKGLSNPRTARRANLLGAAGAALAILAYMLSVELRNLAWIIAAIAVGSVIAVIAARRVQMTQMPQLVAAFNGVGGGAAALVALVEIAHSESPWTLGVVAFTVLIGGVSLTGSFVTFGKLQGIVTTKAVTFPGLRVLMVRPRRRGASRPASRSSLTGDAALRLPAAASSGLMLGVLLVLPIGGADVPIVISLLNAFTGLAVAASGLVLSNVLLLIAGTLVGASGTILTMAMAKAMGRTVAGIVFGAFRAHVAGERVGAPARIGRCGRWRPTTSRSCSTTRSGSSSCPATGSRSPARTTRRPSSPRSCAIGASTSCSASIRSPAGCRGT